MIRRTSLVAAAAVVLLVAGCSDADEPETTPTPTVAPATTEASEPAWAAKYTDEQVAAYYAAIKRYNAFIKESYPYVRDELIERDKAEAVWLKFWKPRNYALLALNYDMRTRDQGYRQKEPDRVVWRRPKVIADDARGLTFRDCLDGRVALTLNGRPVPDRQLPARIAATIKMKLYPDGKWYITEVQRTAGKKC